MLGVDVAIMSTVEVGKPLFNVRGLAMILPEPFREDLDPSNQVRVCVRGGHDDAFRKTYMCSDCKGAPFIALFVNKTRPRIASRTSSTILSP
jgi:hypothetical protein